MTARLASAAGLALALTLAVACSSSDDDSAGTAAAGGSAGNPTAGSAGSATSGTGNAGAPDAATGGSATGGTGNAGGGGEAGATEMPGTIPYANVTAVVTSGNDGAYTFNVSVESADIDCTQFANWWEVLSEDGALLYRRILEHSHTDENGTSDADAPGNTFTRSGGPVPVAADDLVIVRAHMSVGGYNGRVLRGSASGGFTEAPDIGSDFASSVEAADPQPTGCQF